MDGLDAANATGTDIVSLLEPTDMLLLLVLLPPCALLVAVLPNAGMLIRVLLSASFREYVPLGDNAFFFVCKSMDNDLDRLGEIFPNGDRLGDRTGDFAILFRMGDPTGDFAMLLFVLTLLRLGERFGDRTDDFDMLFRTGDRTGDNAPLLFELILLRFGDNDRLLVEGGGDFENWRSWSLLDCSPRSDRAMGDKLVCANESSNDVRRGFKLSSNASTSSSSSSINPLDEDDEICDTLSERRGPDRRV